MIQATTFVDEDGDTLTVEQLADSGDILFTTLIQDGAEATEVIVGKNDLPTLISTLIAFDEANDEQCDEDDA